MKILSVVGARPQFIKAAAMSREIRKIHNEILIHTGQHYDTNMSDIFFDELDIPHPDYNLGISGGNHGEMTARMMSAIEPIMISEKPDAVLLYGDTNSTLAAALVAVKLHFPVIHVESGNRFGSLSSPEEVNRICTDHVSTLRFACTKSALDSLEKENLVTDSYLTGDPMYDAFIYYQDKAKIEDLNLIGLNGNKYSVPKTYYYLTCHRQENTDDINKLVEILTVFETIGCRAIYPVHPRNRNNVIEKNLIERFPNVIFCQPVGYLESISLVSNSEKIVTDSGGVQREAFFARKKCVTVLDYVVWPETMDGHANELSKPDAFEIIRKLNIEPVWNNDYHPFGEGHSCKLMCDIINKRFGV